MTAMNRALKVRSAGGVIYLACAFAACTFQAAPAPALTIEKIHEDLYVIVGDGGNVAVYITDEGVILVDDKYERDHAQIVGLIGSVTKQRVRYILSTHYHADHSGGNTHFAGIAQVISPNQCENPAGRCSDTYHEPTKCPHTMCRWSDV